MTRVMAIDGGLARCGLVAIETDGLQHSLEWASVFTSDGDLVDANRLISDKRVARARELRTWLAAELHAVSPHVVALEEFGFLQGQHATACLAMAYMTIVCECDRANVPIVATPARVWRDELSGLRGKAQRTSTRGMTKSQAMAAKKADREANRARTKEREQRAHVEAVRRVHCARPLEDMFPKKDHRVHALDALGLFCWAVHLPLVKSMCMRGAA